MKGRPRKISKLQAMRDAWSDMLASCNSKDHQLYSAIGGRGIRVCAAWADDFSEFLLDMAPMPNGHVLQRIHSSRNFEPSNCCWAHPDAALSAETSKRRKVISAPSVKNFPARLPSLRSAPTQEHKLEKNVPLSLEILQSYVPALTAFAKSLRMSRPDAEDIAHDTIIKAWRARDQFEGGTNLKAWLFTIAKNNWLSARRHNQCFERISPVLQKSSLVIDCEAGELIDAEKLAERVQALAPHHREVVLLFATGRPYYELARELGIPDGTFKSRLFRAREALGS